MSDRPLADRIDEVRRELDSLLHTKPAAREIRAVLSRLDAITRVAGVVDRESAECAEAHEIGEAPCVKRIVHLEQRIKKMQSSGFWGRAAARQTARAVRAEKRLSAAEAALREAPEMPTALWEHVQTIPQFVGAWFSDTYRPWLAKRAAALKGNGLEKEIGL